MIYSAITDSKTLLKIPLFINGTSFCSKYNPLSEAKAFADRFNNIAEEDFVFFVICGLGSGYQIESLLNKYKNSFVLAVEDDEESIKFCRQFEVVSRLINCGRVKVCSIQSLQKVFLENYLPVKYDNLIFDCVRSWANVCKEGSAKAQDIIKECIKQSSADYSVQSHFGKIWQNNILGNLQSFKSNPSIDISKININKTAAVIAAGPSLDSTINELKNNRDKYIIFSTDTAYSVLVKNKIECDFVISVDCQNVSRTHFFNCPPSSSTVFFFDVSSNPATIEYIRNKNCKVILFRSGHPMSCCASQFYNFPEIETGSGTVTIAAADLAIKLGFTKLRLFGADFSYNSGKAYVKGTYLDNLYYSQNSKIKSGETIFDSLVFRTELISKDDCSPFSPDLVNPVTTSVLISYCEGLKNYFSAKNFTILENSVIENTDNKAVMDICGQHCSKSSETFDFTSFLDCLKQQDLVFYPYIAWLKNFTKDKKLNFNEALLKAKENLSGYREKYE